MLSRLYCQYPEYECIGNSTSSQGLDEQMLRAGTDLGGACLW